MTFAKNANIAMLRQPRGIRFFSAAALAAALFAAPASLKAQDINTLPPEPDARAALDSIRMASHFGQADDIRLMERFVSRFPSSSYLPEVKMMMADHYFYLGEYAAAARIYAQLTPDMFAGETRDEYTYRYAYSLIKAGYYDEAAPYLRGLLASRGYSNAAKFYLAYIDYVNGDYDQAYTGFKSVAPTSERGLEAEYYINQIEYQRGNYREVAQAGERLLTSNLDPQLRPETLRVTGLSWYKLGDDRKARPLLQEYVDLAGPAAENSAVYALAAIMYAEGDYDRAATLFSTLTDNRDELAQSAWLYLGQIQALQGDERGAALAFDRAVRDSWNRDVAETAAFNLAVASASGNRLPFADMTREMEAFILSYPNSPYSATLSRYLVNAYYNQHNYTKALQHIEKIGATDSETLILQQKVYYQLGLEQFRNGDTAAAISSLKKAASGPDREVAAQASLWLGDSYYSTGKYTDASKAYSAAAESREIGANKALANYNLGYSQMKLKEYAKAKVSFDNAIKAKGLSPVQTTDARLRRADCLYYTGHYKEALKEFQDISRKDNSGTDAVYAKIRQADILGLDGNLKEQIRLLEEVLESGNMGVWTPMVLQRLGDAYTEKGEDSKAAAVYAMLIESDASESDKAQSYFAMAGNAENLYLAGKRREALEIYRLMEKSHIPEIYSQAVIGIMRSSDSADEIQEYAEKTKSLPGVTADLTDEATFRMAKAGLTKKDKYAREAAAEALEDLAQDPENEWGARASLELGQYYLDYGRPTEAERVLLNLTDSGCDDMYILAKGYILLSDVSVALGKNYLAKVYLETLRDNYPGNEKEIFNEIDSRLKKLSK